MDLTGQKFYRLTVVEKVGSCRLGIKWKCVCDCGKSKVVISANLNSGNTRSCGCLNLENVRSHNRNVTHGESLFGKTSTEYTTWVSMRVRCYDKKNPQYDNYGGRGIKVCHRWLKSFDNFLEDMGRKPSPQHSLDRYPNNNGNYEPGNVRWATPKEQANNKRTSRILVLDGVSKNLKTWAEEFGIKEQTLRYRINKGQSLESILQMSKK